MPVLTTHLWLALLVAQVEEKALEREKDKQSQERLGEVRRELGELQDKLKPLQMRYRCGAVRLCHGCTVVGREAAAAAAAALCPA